MTFFTQIPYDASRLLGRDSSTTIPCKVNSIVLDTVWLLPNFTINEPSPAIFLAMLDRFILRIEFDLHVGQGVATLILFF